MWNNNLISHLSNFLNFERGRDLIFYSSKQKIKKNQIWFFWRQKKSKTIHANDKRGQTFLTIVTHICKGLYRQKFLRYLEGNSSFSIEIRYSITSDWMDKLLCWISEARTLYTFAFSSSGLHPTCSTSLTNKYSWWL